MCSTSPAILVRYSGPAEVLVASWFAALHDQAPSPSDESSVLRWIEAARAGDRDAFRNIYQQYSSAVYRVARALCRTDAEAEDVTQDTFIQALSNLAKYQARPGVRFQSWLLTISRNLAYKRMRWTRRAALSDEAQEAASEDAAADALLGRAQERSALLQALAELSEREREILALRYGSELAWSEVAGIVSLSDANVRKICERARDKLISRVTDLLADQGEPK